MVAKIRTFSTFFIGVVILFSSCTTNNEGIKIALMLPSLNIARFHKDSSLFVEEAKKLGCEGIVVNADNNEQLQFNQARELIDNGVKTLIIAAVNSNTAALMVRMAQDEGVNTISYDGVLNNCAVDYCITFDNKKLGELMAQYAVSKAPEGDYIILGGDKTNLNAVEIRQGQENIIAPFVAQGKIKITYDTYIEGWNREEAYITMKRYLQLSSGKIPAAVIGANDEIALGVIRAIEEYADGKEVDLPVTTGQDASLDGCQSIMQDKQSMTVYKPIRQLTAVAAEVAFKMSKGEKVEGVNATTNNGTKDIPTIILNLVSVNKQNMESTVIADGFQNKKDVLKY
jgi:D-xylose transport system substrate-binding protein